MLVGLPVNGGGFTRVVHEAGCSVDGRGKALLA